VQVFQNGRLISTATPQLAAQQFGYRGSTQPTQPAQAAAPITSGNVRTPSGAIVDARTGRLVSPPPTPSTNGAATTNLNLNAKANSNLLSGTSPNMNIAGPTTPKTLPSQTIPKTASVPATNAKASGGTTSTSSTAATSTPHLVKIASSSAAPVAANATNAGAVKGTIDLQTADGKTVKLQSFSNGKDEGTLNGKYQCTDLVVRYAQDLKLSNIKSTADIGNGKDAAKNLASLSGGKFNYVDSNAGSTLPTAGSVVSFDGWKSDPAGHVGVVQKVTQVSPTQYQMTLFDQNWPGSQWKTVTFNKQGDTWKGSMTNQPDPNKPAMQVSVSGWANPI
jgi:hypothetical protein